MSDTFISAITTTLGVITALYLVVIVRCVTAIALDLIGLAIRKVFDR